MKRTPLRPGLNPLRTRKPLRQQSAKMRRSQRDLASAVELIRARSLDRCEACVVHELPGCPGRGTDPHHILPRGAGGKHHPSNLLWVSRRHHDWIEEHRAEAYDLGLLQRRGER